MMSSRSKEILDGAVVITNDQGTDETIAAEAVFVMIGREAPLDFFRRSGVRIRGEWRPWTYVSLLLFFALCVFVYHWKSDAGFGGKTWFSDHGLFPFNIADPHDPSTLLGTLTLSAQKPSFYYTLAYTACIVLFGIRRIRRRRTPYVRLQTVTLMAIQVVPLFLLPFVILPWMGHAGWFDEGAGRWIADQLFPESTWDNHGREYWRSVGFILAWPLLPWNVFSNNPMTLWLVISFVQTFVIIPLLVWRYGKGAYCGWICSCGALAETMGDTQRHKMPHGPIWNRLNMIGQVFLAFAAVLLVLRLISWLVPGWDPFESLYSRLFYGSGVFLVPDPVLTGPGDALVRVTHTSVCGSDLHPYHGREAGLDPGTVVGHEFLGEVIEVGSGVEGFSAGDVVVSPFSTSCGSCAPCLEGLTSRCERGQLFGWVAGGTGLQGAQAEYVRVPLADATLVAAPAGLDPEAALLAGDVLSTGLFCAESGGVGAGSVVAVVGCGPVGLMCVLAARELGAEQVFAVDRVPERLALAARFGAVATDFDTDDPLTRVREASAGRGADVVLEAVGSPASSRLALELVRAGGTIAAAGVHSEPHFAFSPGEAYDKNLTYRAGRCPVRSMMRRALALMTTGRIDPSPLVSHRMALEEGPAAYELFDRRREGCTKVILLP